MGIITLRCGHCGGEVQMDDGREFGYCMYCGTRIKVQQDIVSITVDTSQQVENLKKLMKAHHLAGNHKDAGETADRIIEINGADAETWFVKAVSLAATSDAATLLNGGSSELDRCVRNWCALNGTAPMDARTFLGRTAPESLASALGRRGREVHIRRRTGDFAEADADAEEILSLDPSNADGKALRALASLALRGSDPATGDHVRAAAEADPEGWSRDLPAIIRNAFRGPGCDPGRILELARSAGLADDVLCVRVLEAAARRRDTAAVDAAVSALGGAVLGVTDMSRIGMGAGASYSFVLGARPSSAMGSLMRLAFRKSEDVESFLVTVNGLLDGDSLMSEYVYGGDSPERTKPCPVEKIIGRSVSMRVKSLDGTTTYTPAVIMGCRLDSGTAEIAIVRQGEDAAVDIESLKRAFDVVLLDESLEDRINGW